MYQSEQINEIAASLAKLQGQLKDAPLDSKNPHFKSDYASMESVLKVLRPYLGQHGLSFIQTLQPHEEALALVTTLFHTSGQWVRSVIPIKGDISKPQAVGSCITYFRRYSLVSLFGITDTEKDDDANEAQKESERAPRLTRDQIGDINELVAASGLKTWFDAELKAKGYANLESIEASKFKGLKDHILNKVKNP